MLPESNPENKRKRMSEVLKPFELTKCPASRLGEELQSFMKAIVSDREFQTEMRQILVPPQIFFPKVSNTYIFSKLSFSKFVTSL